MPKVPDALTTNVYNGTYEFIPYYRPGVAVVNTTFTHTGYDASADMAPMKFIHGMSSCSGGSTRKTT